MRGRYLAWALMLVVLAGALTIGVVDGAGPRTQEERVQNIGVGISCPVCDGQSVADSDAAPARNIRSFISEQVDTGSLSDDEIRGEVLARFPDSLALRPSGRGVSGLVWALPVAALAVAFAGVGYAFHRWRRIGDRGPASGADKDLVADALDDLRAGSLAGDGE